MFIVYHDGSELTAVEYGNRTASEIDTAVGGGNWFGSDAENRDAAISDALSKKFKPRSKSEMDALKAKLIMFTWTGHKNDEYSEGLKFG